MAVIRSYKGWHRYAVLQRWEIFGSLPQNYQFETNWSRRNLSINGTSSTIQMKYVVGFVQFNDAKDETIKYDIKYHSMSNNESMKLGTKSVCEPGETISFGISNGEGKKESEFDLGVMLLSPVQLSEELIEQEYVDAVTRMASYIRLSLRAVLAPRSRICIFTLAEDGSSDSRGSISTYVHPRTDVSCVAVNAAIAGFENFEKQSEKIKLERLAAASRRVSSSLLEDDAIDEFSDLWEAAEFLVKPLTNNRVGKDIVGHISRRIATLAHVDQAAMKRLVADLYTIRCNIVHNAIDSIRLREARGDLRAIAEALLMDYVGLFVLRKELEIVLEKHGII